MKFVIDVPKKEIIKTLINEGEFLNAFEIKEKDYCEFIESSIGCQIDGIEPKTEIKVEVLNNYPSQNAF